MKSVSLAFCFIRVPKLFATLLMWPLLIGLAVSVTQIVATSAYVRIVDEDVEQFQRRIDAPDKTAELVRSFLFGSKDALPAVRTCSWEQQAGGERPAADDCRIEPLDVAVRVEDPSSYDASEISRFFNGSARKVHVCRDCTADITIRGDGERIADVYNVKSLGVLALTESENEREVYAGVLEVKSTIERLQGVTGTVLLHAPGLSRPVNISKASAVMILVLNTAFLIIITLWLSLVGHRKVLQYFARNDALLPLVAACGKAEFYNSLWVITLLRVGFFLLAALPATCVIYVHSIPEDTLHEFMGSAIHFLLWISAIVSSLGAMTIIASIAELKHRHSMVSFLYKYVPILCFGGGTLTWVFTLFFSGEAAQSIQYLVSSLPLFGLSPIVLAPVFKLDPTLMALHTVIASLLVVILLRMNARWFASHLEDI